MTDVADLSRRKIYQFKRLRIWVSPRNISRLLVKLKLDVQWALKSRLGEVLGPMGTAPAPPIPKPIELFDALEICA